MNASIERRLEALESAGAFADDFMLLLIRIVTPGRPTGEAVTAEVMGQHFNRESSETEDDFIERIRVFATANRKPGQHGVQAVLDDEELGSGVDRRWTHPDDQTLREVPADLKGAGKESYDAKH